MAIAQSRSVDPLSPGKPMVSFHNKELTCHREKGGVTMDTSDLKKILAGIAVTSLLAGATLSVGGCRGNSS